MNIKQIFILFFLFNSFSSYSQKGLTIYWSTLFLNANLNDKWTLVTDLGYRMMGPHLNNFQYVGRTSMRYTLSEWMYLNQGIAIFSTRTSFDKNNKEYGNELRIYQEISKLSDRNKKLLLDYRLRIEERFFDKTSSREKFFSLRFPVRILAGYQVNKKSSIHIGYEHMENWQKSSFFLDQSRYISMFQFHLNNSTFINLMYMYVHRPAFDQDVLNFVINKTFEFHRTNKNDQ